MSNEDGMVPMTLFLQDQKRQDDDLRESRASMGRQIGEVVTELRGLRSDVQSALASDLTANAIKMHDSEVRLTRREKMLAGVAVLALAVPLITSIILRLLFGI